MKRQANMRSHELDISAEARPSRRRNRHTAAHAARYALLAAATALLLAGGILLPGAAQVARAASDPVIAAAGDIACDPTSSNFNGGAGTSSNCRQKYTSDLLVNAGLAAVLDLGDNQYFCGGYEAFLQSYDLSWGRVKSITHPAVGNHEYLTSGGTGCDTTNEGAAGYFDYFGSAAGTPGRGYYSFDIGAWHVIALNSSCPDIGGCGAGSAEYEWLQQDLASHTNYCTLAYWHAPLFSSGGRASPNSQPFWNLLYNYDADLVLNGHDHIYERFAPQSPAGVADPGRGIREFVVGTGGANHTSIATVAANSEVRNTDTYGVLKLTLHSTGYDWQFVHESAGSFTDSGSGNCHGSNPPATSTPRPSPTPSGFSRTVRFRPTADSYVSASSPSINFGNWSVLRADASPTKLSYIRFNVWGLNGQPIVRVRLRLYLLNASGAYVRVRQVADNSWGERTISFENAPAVGPPLGRRVALVPGRWLRFNVTAYVTRQGTYSFAVVTPGTVALNFDSREAAMRAPQLVVELGP